MDSDMDTDIPVHIQTSRFHPELVTVPGLGELQKTDEARMEAWAKGYTKGQADLLILHTNVDFAGLCSEFKSPLGSGTLSDSQEEFLFDVKTSGYYVTVSNDYDEIIDS